eukprot:6236354-Prymnesium_polylepis.1
MEFVKDWLGLSLMRFSIGTFVSFVLCSAAVPRVWLLLSGRLIVGFCGITRPRSLAAIRGSDASSASPALARSARIAAARGERRMLSGSSTTASFRANSDCSTQADVAILFLEQPGLSFSKVIRAFPLFTKSQALPRRWKMQEPCMG